jgi:hypothetical protein
MDAQGWLEELLAELSDTYASRDNVIRDLKELLRAIEDGDDLPKEPVEP